MNKKRVQEFTLRVTQANRTQLIVILYDILEADLESASEALKGKDFKTYEKEVKHASRIVNQLMGSLDYRYSMSYDLLSLYSYINKKLVGALVSRCNQDFAEILDLIHDLRVGFEEASKQDTSGKVMANTQQIYAGLTYGRGKLNESSLTPGDSNRGFRA